MAKERFATRAEYKSFRQDNPGLVVMAEYWEGNEVTVVYAILSD